MLTAFFLSFFSTRMAASGQTISQIPQAIHRSSRAGPIIGVPYTPNSFDQSSISVGHFSLHSPQPLHKSGEMLNRPLGPSNRKLRKVQRPIDGNFTFPAGILAYIRFQVSHQKFLSGYRKVIIHRLPGNLIGKQKKPGNLAGQNFFLIFHRNIPVDAPSACRHIPAACGWAAGKILYRLCFAFGGIS